MTVLLTTHYLDEAERLCDRIGIMHDGSIVALGTPADLLAAVGDEVVELHVTPDGDSAAVLAVLRTNGIAGDRRVRRRQHRHDPDPRPAQRRCRHLRLAAPDERDDHPPAEPR